MWSNLKGIPEYLLDVSASQVDKIVKWILEYFDRKTVKAACAAGAGVAGTFAPTAFYSALGLSSTGPVAGGLFATAQSYGLVFSTL